MLSIARARTRRLATRPQPRPVRPPLVSRRPSGRGLTQLAAVSSPYCPPLAPWHPHRRRAQHERGMSVAVNVSSMALTSLLRFDHFKETFVPTRYGPLRALHARGRGRLPHIIFLCGLASEATDYARLLHRLRRHFSAVSVVDLPGLGLSAGRAADDHDAFIAALTEATRKLAPGPRVLAGHSLGADAARQVVLRDPEHVVALSLFCPSQGPYTEEQRQMIRRVFAVRTRDDITRITRAVDVLGTESRLFTDGMWARLSTVSAQAIVQGPVLSFCPTPAQLGALPPNTQLVWADREALVPRFVLDYHRRHLPLDASVEMAKDTSHGVMVLGPNHLVKMLARFVASRVGTRVGAGGKP